jgi:hypothetical protein
MNYAPNFQSGELGYLSRYSVWLQTGRPGFDPRQRQRIFPLFSVSRPALGPTQPPVQWVPGVLSPGVKRGWGVTMTTHPRSRVSRSCISSLPLRLHGCSRTVLLLSVYTLSTVLWDVLRTFVRCRKICIVPKALVRSRVIESWLGSEGS